jgi:gliding motility-associated-like protein
MKANDIGTKVALAVTGGKFFEVFNFNTTNGNLTYPLKIPAGDQGGLNTFKYGAYGVEFSPTGNFVVVGEPTIGNFLYGTTRDGAYLYQWNLAENDNLQLVKNGKVLGNNPAILGGALQIAPNGKIYMAYVGQDYLGVINFPNRPRPFCKFEEFGAVLRNNDTYEGGFSQQGLPSLLPILKASEPFYIENLCYGDETVFVINNQIGITQGSITFLITKVGGGISIPPLRPAIGVYEARYKFPQAGNYKVVLTLRRTGVATPLVYTKYIKISSLPVVKLAEKDTVPLCEGTFIHLDAGVHSFYEWEDPEIKVRERDITTGINDPYDYAVDYRVKVTDNNGCIGWDTVWIMKKRPPVFNYQIIQPFCDFDNGSITIVPNGNLANYSFKWDGYPNNTSNKLESIGRGDYKVTVISNNGCEKSEAITVTAKGKDDAKIAKSIEGSVCPGTSVELTFVGEGQVTWWDGLTDLKRTVTPIETTTYTAQSKLTYNGVDCTSNIKVDVDVIKVKTPDIGKDTTSCEGTIVKVEGGLDFLGQEYKIFEWLDGNSVFQGNQKDLPVINPIIGLHLKVTDQFGCQAVSNSINIKFNPIPQLDLGPDLTLCKNNTILKPIIGGNADLFNWNNGEGSSNEFAVYKSGIYKLTITKDGCTNTDEIKVALFDPNMLKINDVKSVDVKCNGSNNGSIDIIATGDGKLFEFSIDDGNTYVSNDGKFRDLSPGNYKIWVREEGVCISQWTNEVSISQPDPLGLNFCVNHPSEVGSADGKITVQGVGGNGGYIIYLDGSLLQSGNLSGLKEGTYSFKVIDSKGCQDNEDIELIGGDGLRIEPSKPGKICPGEEITLEVMNNNGGVIKWTELPGVSNSKVQVNPQITTRYHVESTRNLPDGTQCLASDEILVEVWPDYTISIESVKDNSCYQKEGLEPDGEIHVSVNPPGDYVYSIDSYSWSNQEVFKNLAPDSYRVWVKDANSCLKSNDQDVVVGQPDSIHVSKRVRPPSCTNCTDGQIILDISGGNGDYSVLIDNVEVGDRITGLGTGEYLVKVVDLTGCIWEQPIKVETSIPNVITPGGNSANNLWTIPLLSGNENCLVKLFDSNGRMIYEFDKGYPKPWDGTYPNGTDAPAGTYYYIIILDEGNPDSDIRRGTITLIR